MKIEEHVCVTGVNVMMAVVANFVSDVQLT